MHFKMETLQSATDAMRLVISDRFICQKLFIQLRSENQTGGFSGFGIRALNTSSQH